MALINNAYHTIFRKACAINSNHIAGYGSKKDRIAGSSADIQNKLFVINASMDDYRTSRGSLVERFLNGFPCCGFTSSIIRIITCGAIHIIKHLSLDGGKISHQK